MLDKLMSVLRRKFPHKHAWKPSGRNAFGVVTEQRCGCGIYRHHLFGDVARGNISWRDGQHPKGGSFAREAVITTTAAKRRSGNNGVECESCGTHYLSNEFAVCPMCGTPAP